MPAACSGPGLAVLGERWLGSRPDVKGKSRQGPGGSENEQKTVPNKTPSSGPSPRPHLPAPCQPGMGNGVTRKPWHVSGVTSSPLKGALRPRPGLGAAWGAGGCARLPPACGTRTLPSPYPQLLSLQSVSALLAANGQTPCPRHSQAPGQLAPDPETGTLARLPSPVLLAGGRARDPEDSPWASLAAVNGLDAAWLSEKEKNRPSDPNWWKRF